MKTRSTTADSLVYVSHKRLVNKTVSYTENGNEASIFKSDSTCALYDYSSTFTNGVWLDNECVGDPLEIISADFSFSVPGAVRYNSIQVQSIGTPLLDAPDSIGAVIKNFSTGTVDVVGEWTLEYDNAQAVTTFGTVSASGHVSASNTVVVSVFVPNTSPHQDGDYDLGAAGITVSYEVLQ